VNREILHSQLLPREMTTPPYGCTVTVYEDHTTLDLPYLPGRTITLLHGEQATMALVFDDNSRLMLQISREKIDAPTAEA
jgi:hypothetical protein